jgi:glucan 1,3-beta-glucosidase
VSILVDGLYLSLGLHRACEHFAFSSIETQSLLTLYSFLYRYSGDSRIVDEYTMGKYDSNACNTLSSHWASFITESDFEQIAAAGLNFVRIPIGYWAIDSTHTYYCKGNQLEYLQKAVDWARSNGIKVMIDLHGAVGSQNGFDNSGKKGALNWYTQQSYMDRTVAVIKTLAQTFQDDTDTVVIIELLNEPLTTAGPSNALSFTNSYYKAGYNAVRYLSGSTATNFAIAIHDGFQSLSYWANKFQPPTYQQVILDTHIYTVFNNNQVAMSQSARANYYCSLKSNIASSNTHLYTLSGEWTMAPTDCAKYLNGRGIGARYDGSFPGSTKVGSCSGKTGAASKFTPAYISYLKNMFDTQRHVYEAGIGWIMWTWTTESAGDWDYKRGLKYGYITKNLDSNSVTC